MVQNRFELMLRHSRDEELTEDEHAYLNEYNARYSIVKFLYMEKRRQFEKESKSEAILTQFHFTPGKDFLKTPIYDVVNSLLEVDEKTRSGEYKPLDFGDLSWSVTPTDKTKKPYFLE